MAGQRTAPRRTSARRYVASNRADWERTAAEYEARHARALRRYGGRAWGLFRIPERRLRLLDDVRGARVLELGCGSAGWSIALAKAGAEPVGLDLSARRLEQARARMRRVGVTFPLVEAPADRIPFPAARFDLVLSDYGATTFADPRRTIPEVARVLRPGGAFVFAHASPWRSAMFDFRHDRLTRRLKRDYFDLHALRWDRTVEFQLPYAEWVALFTASGLVVERLLEPKAPRGERSSYLSAADHAWARRWPVETIWKLRKGGAPRGSRRPASRRRGGRRPAAKP
ncbi:MAG TPA: class I SAM-dependent methyltransferase [Thermoplasmata archaeon]|nr:class I SAM-dependent methyltransferase [Thermoplasmata archaeon]